MRIPLAIGVAMVCSASASAAFVIDDRAYFAGIEHAFLDFETRGDGTALAPLIPTNSSASMPHDEYAASGLLFDGPFVSWGRVPPPNSILFPQGNRSDALEAAGSLSIYFGGGSQTESFSIFFTEPVRAVGMAIIQQGFRGVAPSIDSTTNIRAFGRDGALLGELRFWGDLIDGGTGGVLAGGVYGDEFQQFQYGFVGLASATPIARLELDEIGAVFDDLHFSAIPAPGAGVTLGLVGLMGVGRRRR
ncbi:MAG: hypothetical protein ACF8QF_00055 [Phycisphaerales bacterium]